MRILLFTGKGGVGKTSVSAATAVRCAQRGYRTVVMSTDPAHSLADCFGVALAPGPQPVADNLWAEEINVNVEIREHWQTVQQFLADFLRRQGFDKLLAEELAIFPGMEELFSLLKLDDYARQRRWDVVVLDCAPTAATIRMLSFPDMIQWYMKRLFRIERRVVQTVKPVVEKMTDIILPDEAVYTSVEDLFLRVGNTKGLLTDSQRSSCRLVANAEKMVVAETQRAYMYLSLFGYTVDGLFINKLLPAELTDPFFHRWKEIQQDHLNLVHERFDPLPIFSIPLLDDEVVGVERLTVMGELMYGDEDPTRFFFHENMIEIGPTSGGYDVVLKLPFAAKGDVDVHLGGDELAVAIGNFRRNLILPRAVAELELQSARLADNRLTISFRGEHHELHTNRRR